ncbi:patatin-like phospholipase family protein [bacterium]|nr:patatin-like phospholipase family protein [bacterium]
MPNRKKIGLALGSGGAKGLAHIGVIKTLLTNNIHIDYIAGTSAGAIIGGGYAALGDISKIEEYAHSFTRRDFIKIFLDPSFRWGLVKGEKMVNFLEKRLGRLKIEDLKIPFRAVATDIKTGKTVILSYGSLIKSIRASSAFPMVFEPVKIGNYCLSDGGLSMPVPAKIVKSMGADIVIAVNLNSLSTLNKTEQTKTSILSMFRTSSDLLLYQLAKRDIEYADIVIEPVIPRIFWTKIVNGDDVILKGEQAAKKAIPKIKELINKK